MWISGRDEEDFLETMDVVGKVGYDSAFTFIYSKRSGTPAAAKEDQVPEEVVKDRFDRLLAQVQEIARERSSRFEERFLKKSSGREASDPRMHLW